MSSDTILYVCGNACVIYNIESVTQKYVYPNENCRKISTATVDQSRRIIALCETTSGDNMVTFIDYPSLKKRKPIQIVNSKVPLIFSTISSDSKFIAVLEGGPTYKLHVFNIDKSKLIASMDSNIGNNEVTFMQFHYNDSSVLLLGGNNILVFYRVSEGIIKPLPLNIFKKSIGFLTTGTFVSEKKAIVCNLKKELILFINTGSCIELNVIMSVPTVDVASSITRWNDGFVLGILGNKLSFYEESSALGEYYKLLGTIKTKNSIGKINSIILYENDLLYTTESSELFRLKIKTDELINNKLDESVQLLLGPFHKPNSNVNHLLKVVPIK